MEEMKENHIINAILIDFGGVLVRTQNQESRRKWETHLGLQEGQLSHLVFDSQTAQLATLGSVPSKAIWEDVAGKLRLSKTEIINLENDFWKYDTVDEILVNYLQSLRPRMKIGILSNAWLNGRQLFIEKFNLGEKFDEIIISAEEGYAKPSVDIYKIAAMRIGQDPGNILFVDDVMENVQGAISAGMLGIQFHDTEDLITAIHQSICA
jgi:glucose-1-phosphatase